MSIVVAVKKDSEIVVAADSQNNFGPLTLLPDNHVALKIRQVGDSFLASTGWGVYANILTDVLAKHKKDIVLDDMPSIFAFFQNLWHDMHEHYSFVNDQCQEEDSPFGDLDASFIVANRNGIFNIASDTSVAQFRKYYAIGSGSDISLGALHALYDSDLTAEQIARKAVAAAISFNVYCGGEIVVRKLAVSA